MRVILWGCAVLVLSGMSLSANLRAEEQAVPLGKLPKPVVDAVKKQFPKSELVSAIEEEGDDDEDIYEVTIKDNGKTVDVTVTSAGMIEGFERELDAKDLPKAVTEALARAYPKATHKKIEAVYEFEDGKEELEFYEVLLVTANTKEIEVKIEEDGKIITKVNDEKAEKEGDKRKREGKDEKNKRADDATGTANWTDDFSAEKAHLVSTGKNPYFSLEPGYQLLLEGGGEHLTITVLDETKNVDGVETRVVEERESKNGKLVEVSRNFFAISKVTNSVYYFGEEVDIYKDGKIVSHDGAWLAGTKDARFGLAMPGFPLVGAKHYQEVAPGVAMDRAEIVSVTETVKVPSGEFKNCLKVAETTPLEKGKPEFKLYAPGVGLLREGSMSLIRYGKAEASKK